MIGARAGQLWRRLVAGLESRGLELPGLESWRHRWSAWWTDRSGRERALLGGLAAVAIVAVILAGVIVPLRDLRAGAISNCMRPRSSMPNCAWLAGKVVAQVAGPARATRYDAARRRPF